MLKEGANLGQTQALQHLRKKAQAKTAWVAQKPLQGRQLQPVHVLSLSLSLLLLLTALSHLPLSLRIKASRARIFGTSRRHANTNRISK